jgi:hypothetical protein
MPDSVQVNPKPQTQTPEPLTPTPQTKSEPETTFEQHIAWSLSGDRIGTACKDKRARFFDPRAPAAVGEFSPHQVRDALSVVYFCNTLSGHEAGQVCVVEWQQGAYADDYITGLDCQIYSPPPKCMTVGFGKQAQREIKVWDTR